MQVIGVIKQKGNVQNISDTFQKVEIVVTTAEQYPQDILIEFAKDKIPLIMGFNIGDHVEIGINLRGRCWTNPQGVDVYFNTISGWKVKSLNTGAPVQNIPQGATPVQGGYINANGGYQGTGSAVDAHAQYKQGQQPQNMQQNYTQVQQPVQPQQPAQNFNQPQQGQFFDGQSQPAQQFAPQQGIRQNPQAGNGFEYANNDDLPF